MARTRKSRHERPEKPVEGLPKVVEIAAGKGKELPRVADFEKSLVWVLSQAWMIAYLQAYLA